MSGVLESAADPSAALGVRNHHSRRCLGVQGVHLRLRGRSHQNPWL